MSRALGSSNIENLLRGERRALSLRIEPTTSEVKGERSDHCATEAPIDEGLELLQFWPWPLGQLNVALIFEHLGVWGTYVSGGVCPQAPLLWYA